MISACYLSNPNLTILKYDGQATVQYSTAQYSSAGAMPMATTFHDSGSANN
jgi:hypothetical protein